MSVGAPARPRTGVGTSVPRVDGVPKVRGAFAFASDLWAEGMLHGATVRSPHPHARIRSVDVSGALAMPGVHAALTAEDLPAKRTFGPEFSDQPVLAADVVRYVGEPVAVVAAETPELARRAAARVVVEYEPLPALLDMGRALQPDAPRIRSFGNVLRHVRIVHGDPDAGADVWVEGYYETGMQDQAPLGPEAGLALPAEDGGVDLHVATQWVHIDRAQVAPCLGLPEDRVRIYLAGIGGAFGAREDVSMQIHACLLALRTGRPVRITYGRAESFLGHVHRHPARIWMRTGGSRDGRLVNVRAHILLDGGPYASSSTAVVANATSFASGPYEVPNALLEGTVVFTNNPVCGAMRGFGSVQAAFAYEAQMDKLAAAVGMDPVEVRLRNVVGPGSVLPTGQVIRGSAPAREVIERCVALPLPDEPSGRDAATLPGGAGNVSRGERVRRGVGFAFGYKNVAYSEGYDDDATAEVRLMAGPDGAVAEVHTAAAEVGQGIHTVDFGQVVRSLLGDVDVQVLSQDTTAGSAGSSSASRQTLMTGGAVAQACEDVQGELRARLGAGAVAEVAFDGDLVLVDGVPMADAADVLSSPIASTRTYHHPPTTAFDERGQGDIHAMFTFAAERAVVDVDLDLGLVRVVHVNATADVGTAINPTGVTGQIEGGTAQGIGLALTEELRVEGGAIRNASFTDYLLPTTVDMPTMVSVFVEDPEPGVPLGIKGAGESSIVVAPAAVAAAIRAATGHDLNRIPVTPDDVAGLRPPVDGGPWPPTPDVPGNAALPFVFGLGLSEDGA